MPSHKKNYNRKKYKNFRKTKNKKFKKKNKNNEEIDLKHKNLKFIKRSKESEALQRKHKEIEDQFRDKAKALLDEDLSDVENEIEENAYDQLVSCFEDKDTNKVWDSSSDEEVVNDNEDEDEEDLEEEEEEEGEEEADDEDEEELEKEANKIDRKNNYDNGNDSEISMDNENNSLERTDEDFNNIGESNAIDNKTIRLNDEDEKDEIILEEELDEETELNENSKNSLMNDMFSKHFEYNLDSSLLDNVNQTLLFKKPIKTKSLELNWPIMGKLLIEIPIKLKNHDVLTKKPKQLLSDEPENFAEEGTPPTLIDFKDFNWKLHYIKHQVGVNIPFANAENLKTKSNFSSNCSLTPLQVEIFSVINNYQNLFYCNRSLENGEEIRLIYCLHALNHMMKTRTKILHHNAKLSTVSNKNQNLLVIPDIYKDQGFVRPKILILLPFRESAYRVVNMLSSLFFGENTEKMKTSGGIKNYKRFMEEFTGETIRFPKHNPKPEDYEKTFAGNTDDTFRIGISLTKKSLKLYTDFYSSDIIIASPLGLRMIIGAPGDKERDYDFLSSIEIVILDQADLFFAQNWDHLLHVFEHFDLQLQSVRNTDFSRIRSWCLKGHTKFYRQMLLFTTHEIAEFRSLFNKQYNYRGKVRLINPIIIGSIKNVLVEIPQIFHKISVSSIESSFDERFKYFVNEILPQYRNSSMAHCMIYIPSYFDYVRIRNYFKSETINFVQICEYTKDGKIARARDMFYHSSAHFLLYSERGHYFRRTRIKGIRHLIMYQPTFWPQFYPEIINLMQSGNQNPNDGLDSSMSITILYTKYDVLQVSSIIGTERALKMLNSGRTTHMFMSGE